MSKVQKVNFTFLVTVIASNMIFPYVLRFVENRFLNLFLSQVAIALPSFIYLIVSKENLPKAVRFNPIRPKNVILLILFSILISPVFTLVNAISMLFSVNVVSTSLTSMIANSSFVISALVVALLPAVLEESVYRGIFFNEYSKLNKRKAIILSGLLFGLMHGNLNQFVYACLLGALFCLLVEATDSLFASMIVHFFINLRSVCLVKLLPALLGYVNNLYQMSIETENSAVSKFITDSFGTDNISLENILANSANTKLSASSLGDIFSIYGLPALICGILAFVVFKTIARNANRLDVVKEIFSKSSDKSQSVSGISHDNAENPATELEESKQSKFKFLVYSRNTIFTWSLVAGIGLTVYYIVVNELSLRGII